MFPILQVGPLAIQASGLIILAGAWLGLSLSERYAATYGIKSAELYNLVFYSILGGLLVARLAYVISYPQAFISSPFSLVSLNPGLLDRLGGAAGAILVGYFYARRKGMPFWQTLDALTPAMAVMFVAVGISHLASGAAFGSPGDLPWAIELWGARRHPSQVYEILAALLILGLILPASGILRPRQAGVTFLAFVAMSASVRLFLEAFRGDSALLPGGVRSAQIIAWLALAASLYALYLLQRRDSAAPGNNSDRPEQSGG